MNASQSVLIASDHAGFELKQNLKNHVSELKWIDLGPEDLSQGGLGLNNADSVDYPDFADKLIIKLKESPQLKAILICGSGQGMAMRANKYNFVRAALCWNETLAELSRQHNDANVLCLGSRVTDKDMNFKIVKKFFSTDFEGGRHQKRVDKITGELKCSLT